MSSENGANAKEVRLGDLYQEVILDHNRNPRNFKKIEGANAYAHGVNPLCGDDYHLYLYKDGNGVVRKVGFEGQGCAISKSSASMMTTMIEGKSLEEARRLKDSFIELLTKDETSEENKTKVGRLKIFQGVRQYPIRVKCATLIWRALEEALKNDSERKTQVTTESDIGIQQSENRN